MSSTATAEAVRHDHEVQEQESLFVSKIPNHKLFVRQPYRYIENGLPIFHVGETIEFVNHEFRTSDPRLKRFLRSHRLFGTTITEVTSDDLRPQPMRQEPQFIRGAATTKPVQSAQPQGQVIDRSFDDLMRQALAANPGAKVAIPCGFEGCDYVATGDDETSAKRSLNGHRTLKGHHPKS